MSGPFTNVQRIISKPDVMGGKPCIRGTRIPVETVVRRFAERYAIDEVLADYPIITEDDVRAALEYAAALAAALPEKVA